MTIATLRAIEPSAIPLYSQVRERLRERIVDGTYAPQARLPSESEIGTLLGVSRITVRQALGDLQKEGVIVKVPGKGTFVAETRPSQELARLEGFGEAMSRKGHRIVNRVVKHALVEASPLVAARLRVAPGAPVTEIHRVRWLDREPVSFEITYLPPAIGERLRGENLAERDIFLILEADYGITLGHADIQIGAINADVALAQALRVEPGAALLRIERLTWTADGVPLDFEYLYVRGEAFQYALRLPRHP
ncbi:GntR family transcriptional regulator [Telluria mixta]|uniref:GntR family transcriptional regulator n=1 Tax=Telluria mixta TaxID=34071 RepID=A0ABT2BUZ6_9BURK|nr:GntR family transcriptional regulator [Telluria mixta]MCS0628958.1 GntR family transcriptional regulator [Telluria mixta]WEM97405.1 GntR family transcriptional regulator [Telluria mixta]